MIRRHPLDVGEPEPDWGQRNDDPRDPDPAVTVRVSDPDPEPDWKRLRGDGSAIVQTPTPAPRTPSNRQKQPQTPRVASPHEMPGGVIYRPRDRLAPSRRSDLEATELAMFYKEPAWVVLQRRKDDGCWRW